MSRKEAVLGGPVQRPSPPPCHRVWWRAIWEAALAKESRCIFQLNVTRKTHVFVMILSFGTGLGQTWIQMSTLGWKGCEAHMSLYAQGRKATHRLWQSLHRCCKLHYWSEMCATWLSGPSLDRERLDYWSLSECHGPLSPHRFLFRANCFHGCGRPHVHSQGGVIWAHHDYLSVCQWVGNPVYVSGCLSWRVGLCPNYLAMCNKPPKAQWLRIAIVIYFTHEPAIWLRFDSTSLPLLCAMSGPQLGHLSSCLQVGSGPPCRLSPPIVASVFCSAPGSLTEAG